MNYVCCGWFCIGFFLFLVTRVGRHFPCFFVFMLLVSISVKVSFFVGKVRCFLLELVFGVG